MERKGLYPRPWLMNGLAAKIVENDVGYSIIFRRRLTWVIDNPRKTKIFIEVGFG